MRWSGALVVQVTAVPGWWTVEELSNRTNVPASTIRHHCRTGRLKSGAVQANGRWMIAAPEAEIFAEWVKAVRADQEEHAQRWGQR